jgi:hypothetical protein
MRYEVMASSSGTISKLWCKWFPAEPLGVAPGGETGGGTVPCWVPTTAGLRKRSPWSKVTSPFLVHKRNIPIRLHRSTEYLPHWNMSHFGCSLVHCIFGENVTNMKWTREDPKKNIHVGFIKSLWGYQQLVLRNLNQGQGYVLWYQ